MTNAPTKSSASVVSRAAKISVAASLLIFLLKAYAYKVTQSQAVMSDALESIINVLAAGVALFVIRFASQPADYEHPYGHGKAEYFSSAFEGGMIFFAALMIIIESAKALIFNEPTRQLEVGILIIGAASLLNLILGFYLKHIGKTHHSEALKASGAHVLSDVWTTLGVMVGLGLVLLTGLNWLDPLVAMLVGANLGFSGYKIVRKSMGGLLDEVDETTLIHLSAALEKNRVPETIEIHHLRTIRSGRFHHVDAHVAVPEYMDIARVHREIHEFERRVVGDYPFDGEIAFHIDPCKKSYCPTCSVVDCPIRQAAFGSLRPWTVKSLTAGPHPTIEGTHDDYGSDPSKKTN